MALPEKTENANVNIPLLESKESISDPESHNDDEIKVKEMIRNLSKPELREKLDKKNKIEKLSKGIDYSDLLSSAFSRVAEFDITANKKQMSFVNAKRWIITLGVVATFLAVMSNQVNNMISISPWVLRILQILLISVPLIAAILTNYVDEEFKNARHVLFRAAGAEIWKHIYFYRTLLQLYPERSRWLSQNLMRIQRRLLNGLEGNLVIEYYGGILPRFHNPDDPNSDPGFNDISADEYIRYRLDNQLMWHKRRIYRLEKERLRMRWNIWIVGGISAAIASLGGVLVPWIAVLTAYGVAFKNWEELRDIANTKPIYSKVFVELTIIRDNWTSIPPKDRRVGDFFELVRATERILWSEYQQYVPDTQEAIDGIDLSEWEDMPYEKNAWSTTLEEHFKEALGSPLAEEASSELVQQELAAMAQAFSAPDSSLSHSLKQIEDEFAGIDIGRDTPKEVLNDLLSRLPTTGEVKG